MSSIYDWSIVAGNNASSDSLINWAEGQAPSTVNNSARQLEARVAEILSDLGGALAATGTGNGIVLTPASNVTALANGLMVVFRAASSNTGAVTINFNGTGAKAARKMDSTGDVALVANEIRATGIYAARYSTALNGGAGAWLILNPTLSAAIYALSGLTTVDNTVPRFNGTAGALQTSGVIITDADAITPPTNDTGALGSATVSWSDLFLASGAVINWNNGDVTATHSANALAFAGASSGYTFDASVTVSGNVTSSQNFLSSTTTWLAAPSASGTMLVRPGGSGVTTGQLSMTTTGATFGAALTVTGATTLSTLASGAITSTSTITSSQNFVASGTTALFATTGAGDIFLRPNGTGSAAGQLALASTGDVTVNGDLTVTNIDAVDVDVSSTVVVGTYSGSGATEGTIIGPGFANTSRTVTSTIQHYGFTNPNGGVGNINTSGLSTNFVTSSDKRLKENWRTFDSGGIIDALEFWEFNWKADGQVGYGVLAQDAKDIFPPAISYNEEWDRYQSDNSKYVPVAMHELKNLRSRVAALEAHSNH